MKVELNHVFLFVPDEKTAVRLMTQAGLRVNYARTHFGQGTQNLCACPDDIFIELIWLNGETISPESERITLGRRARGEGSPIGISWRGAANFETEDYKAPYLPSDRTISVATDSFDVNLPFLFQSLSSLKPIDRPAQSVGMRQTPHLATLNFCDLIVPNLEQVSSLLSEFDKIHVKEGEHGVRFEILDAQDEVGRSISWSSERK